MKNRQLDILIHLLQCKKTTYNALATQFEVSSKTIERDISRLAASGIPVYCQQGAGGGVYIDENYKFSTSFFTPEEVYHMITALHIAKTFTSNPLNQGIVDKLCLVAPNVATLFSQTVHDYFSLDLYDAPVNFDDGVFVDINKCLDFKLYADIDELKQVACLGYVYKADGIYLFAHADDYLLLKIGDIQSFFVTDTVYTAEYLHYSDYKQR